LENETIVNDPQSPTLGQRAGAYVKKILQQEPAAHLTDMQRRDILAIEKRYLKAD